MLLVFEWQTEQNKTMIKMKKKSDEGKIPMIKINGLFPNTILTVHKFQLLFGHSTQVKEINLLCTPLPTNQHIFFGAYKTS